MIDPWTMLGMLAFLQAGNIWAGMEGLAAILTSVSTANAGHVAAALTRGQITGAVAGAAASRPNLAAQIISIPFKILYAPIWYASGQAALHGFMRQTQQAHNTYKELAKGEWKVVGDVAFTASREYLAKLEGDQFNLAQIPHIQVPAFNVGSFDTPDNQIVNFVMMDVTTSRIVFTIVIVASGLLFIRVLAFALKKTVRYIIRGSRSFNATVEQQRELENQRSLERTLAQPSTVRR